MILIESITLIMIPAKYWKNKKTLIMRMHQISRSCANSNFPRILLRKGLDAPDVSWGSACKQTTKSTITISRISDPNSAALTTSGFVRTAHETRSGSDRICCQNPIVFTYNWALSDRSTRLICMVLSSSTRDVRMGHFLRQDASALNQLTSPDAESDEMSSCS